MHPIYTQQQQLLFFFSCCDLQSLPQLFWFETNNVKPDVSLAFGERTYTAPRCKHYQHQNFNHGVVQKTNSLSELILSATFVTRTKTSQSMTLNNILLLSICIVIVAMASSNTVLCVWFAPLANMYNTNIYATNKISKNNRH